jgi:plasmid stabilization system protein ParE
MSFIAEVHRTISFVVQNPYAAAAVSSGIRRKVLDHFPYNILYAAEDKLIVIFAVAHQKRRPRCWCGRTKRLKERMGRTSK